MALSIFRDETPTQYALPDLSILTYAALLEYVTPRLEMAELGIKVLDLPYMDTINIPHYR